MYKVLLTDDEPFILEGLRYLINWEEYGAEIVGAAHDGLEALEFIREHEVDILITDVKMPRMSGLELIQTLKEQGYGLRYIILSGYEDFSYIKMAFNLGIENYLVKPINQEELLATLTHMIETLTHQRYLECFLKKDIDIIRDNILYRWVSYSIEPEELRERANLLDIDLEQHCYQVSIIKLKLPMDEKFHCNGKIMEPFLEICKSRIANSGSVFATPEPDIIIIFAGGSLDANDLRKTIEQCVQNIKENLDLDCFATIGNPVANYQLVAQSYFIARQLQNYALFMPPDSIVTHSETSLIAESINGEPWIDVHKFTTLFISKDKNSLFEAIDAVFAALEMRIPNPNPALVQDTAIKLLMSMVNIARSLAYPGGNPFVCMESTFSELFIIKRIPAMVEWLKRVVSQILDLYIDRSKQANPTIRKALELIHSKSPQGLSLKTLALELNCNANYLGQLFKTETGEFFSDYLNKFRVFQAKELLRTTPFSATEIAERVGFTDPNYFYRVFKKCTGHSPSEYRNRS